MFYKVKISDLVIGLFITIFSTVLGHAFFSEKLDTGVLTSIFFTPAIFLIILFILIRRNKGEMCLVDDGLLPLHSSILNKMDRFINKDQKTFTNNEVFVILGNLLVSSKLHEKDLPMILQSLSVKISLCDEKDVDQKIMVVYLREIIVEISSRKRGKEG